MGVWDERPPVRIPGLEIPGVGQVPQQLDPVQQVIALITGRGQQPGSPTGPDGRPAPGAMPMPSGDGGSPARPGGPPPQMTPGVPGSPGSAMSPAQAGGPLAQFGPYKNTAPTQYDFKSKGARNSAAINSAIGGVHNAVIKFKQQRFEKEAAEAARVGAIMAQGQIIQQQGGPKTEAEKAVAAQHQQMMADPKIQKLLEKASKDPMSGAYVGLQRARDYAMQQEAAQAKIEQDRAQAEELRKRGDFYKSQADYWATEKARIEREKIAGKQTTEQNKIIRDAQVKGFHAEFDENGKLVTRAYTKEDIAADPMKQAMLEKVQKETNAKVDRVKQGWAKLRLDEERLKMQKDLLALKQSHEKFVQGGGLYKYNTVELNRMDQAQISYDQISEMRSIVERRPDLFGPGGWLNNKLKIAYGEQDPDAVRIMTLAETSALTMVGMHARNAAMVRDMKNMNSKFWQNQEAVLAQLDQEISVADNIRTNAGRPESLRAPGGAATTTKSKDSLTITTGSGKKITVE